jgi:carnitine-CoA ligase
LAEAVTVGKPQEEDWMTKTDLSSVTLKGEPVEVATMPALIAARAAEYGNKPLVHSQGETLSYAEADRRSNRIASSLARMGIESGDVVATLMYNSVDHVAFWFACAKLGVVWAPLNVSLRGEDLAWTVGNTTAKLFAVDAELLEHVLAVRGRLTAVETLVVRGEEAAAESHSALPFAKLLDGEDVRPAVEILPSTPNAITYTGGSTGMPKGVLASNLYYIAACMRYREITAATPDDVHLPFGQLFHGSGQQNGLLGPMFCGASTVMPKWFSASRYWDRVREHGVTIIDPIGPLMMILLAQPPSERDREHGIRVTVGGACGQIPPERRKEFEERFGVELNEQYAQTETGACLISETPDDRRWGSSGRPRGWAEISIRDEDDFPLPTGEVGEITLRPRDAHVFMVGYFNNPEETAATWRNMWHHSGDLGYVDEDGYLFFLGRKAYWMRRKGENVSSYEVERIIDQHEDVIEVAVVGVPSEAGDEDIKAYVVLREVAEFDPEALIEWCEAGLAYFKVPRYLEQIKELPHTAAKGDPDRAKLRERGVGDAWENPAEK